MEENNEPKSDELLTFFISNRFQMYWPPHLFASGDAYAGPVDFRKMISIKAQCQIKSARGVTATWNLLRAKHSYHSVTGKNKPVHDLQRF